MKVTMCLCHVVSGGHRAPNPKCPVHPFEEPCDLECGDRFYKGAAICRHSRTVNQSAASLHKSIGLEQR